jgi:hypothetical protein
MYIYLRFTSPPEQNAFFPLDLRIMTLHKSDSFQAYIESISINCNIMKLQIQIAYLQLWRHISNHT